ncbi:MAG: (2Fe-2S) ferredoxin domain-containing protein [Clostridia bacterium]|nr:(2Fe-2S) ferredoxin domain-containing protein [Clostridia bacterium]MBR0121547.1 (2Fe-2S) ferredoxin domain-containing protein [Clostridia bacterium]
MKSLAELQAIKDKMKNKVVLREGTGEIRVVVGMATCGIAAGARPVLNAFVEGVNKEDLSDKVTVSQTGCIGICQYEPVVEVFEAGKEKVTYVKMNAEKAAEVIESHLKNGNVVEKYTIGANQ